MATIKQIKKQIETSAKRIADFDRKIAMYVERRDKNIAAANKKFGTAIKVDDIIVTTQSHGQYSWREYSLPTSIRDIIGFEASSKITNACDSMEDNIKNGRIESANLSRLKEELAALEAKAKADADNYDNTLEDALRSAMADFRVVWFDRMKKWFFKHYNFIKKNTPAMVARRERVRTMQAYFDRYWASSKHRRTSAFLSRVVNDCNAVINDEANRYDTKAAYLEAMEHELELSWEQGIVKLTKKCQAFGIDNSKVVATHQHMTAKGFETYLEDGKPRSIHARVIWAAEYSDYVAPHTRYIVTEKAVK